MNSAVPWCNQDLFFLEHSVRRGRSVAEVAGFLSRHECEVREKAKELGIPPPCSASPPKRSRSHHTKQLPHR
jgi:hypothetical protein